MNLGASDVPFVVVRGILKVNLLRWRLGISLVGARQRLVMALTG